MSLILGHFFKAMQYGKKIKDAEVEVLKQIHNIYNKALAILVFITLILCLYFSC